jgi:defect-in-organelle-trafficking protein DotC
MIPKQLAYKGLLQAAAFAVAAGFAPILAQAQEHSGPSSELSKVLRVQSSPANAQPEVGYARRQIIKEAATGLGARAGLTDRSREIYRQLDGRAMALDLRFNFNTLVIGSSVLPPVISEARDVVALEALAMRTAAGVFRIDEPARFAMPTPTWRDWLYLGLDSSEVSVPTLGSNGPGSDAEQKLWEHYVREGYEIGRQQAGVALDLNLARLQRAHEGMSRYYELWQRGMVSAPIVAVSSEVVVQEDPTTISVGNTLRRITKPSQFQPDRAWKPLE